MHLVVGIHHGDLCSDVLSSSGVTDTDGPGKLWNRHVVHALEKSRREGGERRVDIHFRMSLAARTSSSPHLEMEES